MRIRTVTSLALLSALPAFAQDRSAPARQPQRVLYLGNPGSERSRAWLGFLEENFARARCLPRRGFEPSQAEDADVVLLDWSLQDVEPDQMGVVRSPLGPRDSWTRPLVLLGGAGLLLAGPWQLTGAYGCACLQPFAYDLRPHAVFRQPLRVDVYKTMRLDRPESWGPGRPVDVLALRGAGARGATPGWCSYRPQLSESPDIEILCGGLNSKAEDAAAIWRQGQVLHFGFDLSPSEMNGNGKALLVNAIVYIARFAGRQPILRAPSPLSGQGARARSALAAWLECEEQPLDWFTDAIDPAVLAGVDRTDRSALRAWFALHRAHLRPNAGGKLTIDRDVEQLGVAFDTREFFTTAIGSLGNHALASAAGRALARFAPEGPGATASGPAWQAWHEKHRTRLFFSDWGGYRWYVRR
jgi:hypothetical protein